MVEANKLGCCREVDSKNLLKWDVSFVFTSYHKNQKKQPAHQMEMQSLKKECRKWTPAFSVSNDNFFIYGIYFLS